MKIFNGSALEWHEFVQENFNLKNSYLSLLFTIKSQNFPIKTQNLHFSVITKQYYSQKHTIISNHEIK